jgi:hypothetical protein
MHPEQPSISMSKNDEFDESSDSGHASAVTPVLNEQQNTYLSNGSIHQPTLLSNGPVFQPQLHQSSLISSKEFQQVRENDSLKSLFN